MKISLQLVAPFLLLTPLFPLAAGTPDSAGPLSESAKWKWSDPILLGDKQITIDLQERLRMELRSNTFDFNSALNHATDDSFLLQRFRVGVLYQPRDLPWVKTYVSGQDSRELFSEDRPNTPFVLASEGDDTFDLREAWLEIGQKTEFPVSLKAGRQLLVYGDERLIGSTDWNNFGRTFDAVKLSYQASSTLTIDAFASSVVTMEGYEPADGDHDWEFNDSHFNEDKFCGIYATDKGGLAAFQQTEAYLIYRDKTTNNPNYAAAPGQINPAYDIDQQNYTLGFRIKSTDLKKLQGFDYEADFAYQWGTGSLPGTGAGGRGLQNGLVESAFAAHTALGYTWDSSDLKPRLGLDYAVASGDSDSTDGMSQSFMNLFPTNHKFYGAMDAFAWKNIHDPSISFSIKPTSQWTLKLDHHVFFLYTNEDSWYRANAVSSVRVLNAAARNASTYAGQETDITATYIYNSSLSCLVGYSHFFAGDYLRATGASSDANFFYVQTTLKL